MTPDELLQLKKLLVDDAVAAIEAKANEHQQRIEEIVRPAIAKVDGMDKRVTELESKWWVLVKGAVIYSSVVAALIGWGYGWLKSHLAKLLT